MRIALFGPWPPPSGGVAVHLAELAEALRLRGGDVQRFDLSRRGPDQGARVPARGLRRCAGALARCALERRLVHLHTSGANSRSWAVALWTGHVHAPGLRPLLTIHSGSCPTFLAATRARRELARHACRAFGHVIAVSEAIAEALWGCGVAARRIAVLPAFLGDSFEGIGLPPTSFVLLRACAVPLYAAALGASVLYGGPWLAAAFQRVRVHRPRAALALFGPGSERAPEAGRGRGVYAFGDLAHPQALGIVAGCDVFVRPTSADGDSMTVREALSLGRPVVASDACLRPSGCLLAHVNDVEQLAMRMREASELPPARLGGEGAPRGGRGSNDTLDHLMAVYHTLWGERPIPIDSTSP